MKEIIITSSVLILCIMLIRILVRGKISGRLLYALWLLVALRLIVPSSAQIHMAIGSIEEFRIMDIVEALEERFGDVTGQLAEPVRFTMSLDSPLAGRAAQFVLGEDLNLPDSPDGPTSVFLAGRIGLSWLDLLRWIWFGGMVVVALWIILTNIVFSVKMRRRRKEFALPEELSYLCDGKHGKRRKIRLYTTDYPASSCLYGLPGREVIYLTEDITADPDKLRHVVTHELCHRKHGDSFWSLLRGALVCVYWLNPLVWAAAVLSKQDCELACDEAALMILGEEERIPYGETLLSIITGRSRLSDIACTATTMHGNGRSVKERIRFIAEKPRVLGASVVAVLLAVLVVSVLVFTKQPTFSGYTWEGEITLSAGDMQITLPETIAGISSYDTAQDGDAIVIYQVRSGREAGSFRTLSYEEAVALVEEGREIVPVGSYGRNENLRAYMRALRGYAPTYSNTVYGSADAFPYTENGEEIETEEVPDGNPLLDTEWEVVPLEESVEYVPNEEVIREENAHDYLPNEQITGENGSDADSVTWHEYTTNDATQIDRDMPADSATEYKSTAADSTTKHSYTSTGVQAQGMIAHEDVFIQEGIDSTGGVAGTDVNDETTYLIEDSSQDTPTAAESSTNYLPNEQITTIVTAPEQQDASAEGISDKCYVYLKADYAAVKEQDLEEMEYINSELETAAGRVIVISINRKLREELFHALAKNRTEYLGNASKTGALVSALPQADALRYRSIALHTLETEPETALSLEVRYELTDKTLADTDADLLFFNAAMLFATIRNLDECSFVLEENASAHAYRAEDLSDGDGQQYSYSSTLTYRRDGMEEALGTLWSDEDAGSDDQYYAWLEELYARIADYLS